MVRNGKAGSRHAALKAKIDGSACIPAENSKFNLKSYSRFYPGPGSYNHLFLVLFPHDPKWSRNADG